MHLTLPSYFLLLIPHFLFILPLHPFFPASSCPVSAFSSIPPLLNPSFPSFYLSCIAPVLHPSSPASLRPCIPTVLHHTCPASHLSCITPVLHTFYPASHLSYIHPDLHPTCPVSLQSFISPVLHPSSPASHLSCIPPVLNPACPASLLSWIPPVHGIPPALNTFALSRESLFCPANKSKIPQQKCSIIKLSISNRFDIEPIRYRNETKTFKNVTVLIDRRV